MKEAFIGEISAMREFFERSTRVLDEGDSGFAPKDGMFTVAQQVAHAGQTVDWFIQGAFAPGGFSMDFERLDQEVRAVTSLTAAREAYGKSCDAAIAVIHAHSEEEWGQPLADGPIMGGMPRLSIFSSMTDHSAHHRGALTVYTRLLGKVPPMPYVEM
jgi:uncharacterized damage-inducible protein DinB